jgi:hypothetical protein
MLNYGWVYPQALLVFTITLVYSVVSPLILVFGAIYFGNACEWRVAIPPEMEARAGCLTMWLGVVLRVVLKEVTWGELTAQILCSNTSFYSVRDVVKAVLTGKRAAGLGHAITTRCRFFTSDFAL